eukprot:CAMPEP_0180339774 /NCGR_PEP_ID=MMETSP0989-20121125/290_1 /TAXON_ID=697907 /ORGANISM="non described non described, Strain CCMP2293" /LENGTH=275 /DNA_ID=CAMNT_0022328403 /DNA_START=39 /DNA_END=864 /DNA_ORIENTATION=+
MRTWAHDAASRSPRAAAALDPSSLTLSLHLFLRGSLAGHRDTPTPDACMERQAPARQRWGGIKAHASRWVHHTSRIKHQASHGRRTCDRTLRHVGEALWMTPRAHLLARTACSDAASSGAVLSPSRNAHSPRCHREHGGGLRTYSRALDASLLASPRLASPRTIDASTPARRPSTLGDGMRASAALAATRLTRRCPLPLSGCALALGSSLALQALLQGREEAPARGQGRGQRATNAPARLCLPLLEEAPACRSSSCAAQDSAPPAPLPAAPALAA